MIITILCQKYLRLRKGYLQDTKTKEERNHQPSISYQCCTSWLLDLFQWQTNKGKASFQIMRLLTHKKLLGYHGFLNATTDLQHYTDEIEFNLRIFQSAEPVRC
jgi:hypothetical protein